MTLRILHAARDRQSWLESWKRTLARDPFAHPDYCDLFTAPGITPLCAIGENTERGPYALFPFLLRELSAEPWTAAGETRRDIAVPAGYGGAYAYDAAARARGGEFWNEFGAWARDHAVVCADARISLNREEILPLSGWRETQSCDNVVVDLADMRDRGIGVFSSSLRRNIRQAQRAGVHAGHEASAEAFTAFRNLYWHTMGRRGAINYYYFSPRFFDGLQEQVDKGFARLFVGRSPNGTPLCAELVLLGARRAYDFLAGSDETARRLHANELLRFTVCRWLAEQREWDELVLGGGNAPDDALFQYKLRFAPQGRRTYHVGSKIYDPEAYAALTRQRDEHQRSQGLARHVARRFPEYR
jgi:hypothetical protein